MRVMRAPALLVLLLMSQAAAAAISCPSLAPAQVEAVATNATCLAAGHVDADGRSDVAVGTDANKVIVYKRNADLTFTPFEFALSGRPVAIAMGDYDENGSADVAVVHGSANVTVILLDSSFESIGGSTFRAHDNPVAIATGDLSEDGHLDLVVANMFSNTVSVFTGAGDGTFVLNMHAAVGTFPTGVAIADFDGDTHLDVVVPNFGTSRVSVVYGNGTGQLNGIPQEIGAGTDPTAVATGDFNGDAIPDIAVSNLLSNDISVILGGRSGPAFTPAAPVNHAAETAPVAITAAHFDAGSNLDLIVSNGAAGTVSLFSGNGDGTFALSNARPVAGLPWATASGQFDNSSVKGIAAAHFASPGFSIFSSNCPGPPVAADFNPKFGPVAGGQTLRLTGYTLADTIKVELGTCFDPCTPEDGVEATILSQSANVVTVSTPAHAHTYPFGLQVRLTTSSGNDIVDGATYTYVNTPVLAGVSPNNGSRGPFQIRRIYSTSAWFDEVVTEVKFGDNVARITGLNTEPPQHAIDVEVPASTDGALGSVPVTISTLAGTMNDAYLYTDGAPLATPGNVALDEDTPTALIIEGTDADILDEVTYTVTTPPAKGTLSIGLQPDPTEYKWPVIYTPSPNANGPDSFTFTLNDGSMTSAPATVSISITPVNDAPVALEQLLTMEEDGAGKPITLAGTDVDGSIVGYNITSQPTKGVLSGSGANRTYTPNSNAYGTDSFAFTVSDGSLTSPPETITIEITPVNDTPAATPQSPATNEDTAKAITLAGVDADGDSLGFAIVTQPAKGTLTGSGANRTYTPNLNANGPDSFTFTVKDGTTTSAPATVAITINPVNDTPAATPQTVNTTEDAPAKAFTLGGVDVENDALTFNVATQPTKGALGGSAANLTYTPNANAFGADSLTFTVHDGELSSAPATVTINIAAVGDAPVALAQSVSTPEDMSRGIVLQADNVDGDPLTFAITQQPARGTLSGTGANRIYFPRADVNGNDSFAFSATNATATSAPAVVSIGISPVNDRPVARPERHAVDVSTPEPIQLVATDADNDVLTYAISAQPLHGTISGAPPAVTYTPVKGFIGVDGFEFTASDSALTSGAARVRLEVRAPTVTLTDGSVPEAAGKIDLTVKLSEKPVQPVTVDYSTVDGTATAPQDYTKTTGMLKFAVGETEKKISVPIISDQIYEPAENFGLQFTNALNALMPKVSVRVDISDDDLVPVLIITGVSALEGHGGKKGFVFVVTRIGETTQPITFNYQTVDDVAKAGSDYETQTGSLTILPGETTKTITIQVLGDKEAEANETFFVKMTNVVNATPAHNARGMILNDDPSRFRPSGR